jgi:cell division protein FtsI/penicillin-binding protein 2
LAGFPFGQRLWKDFLQDGCYHNNSSLVLHAKLNREKQIELKTINKFYNRSLPVPVDREWRGSIVSTSDTLGVARWQVHAGTLHAYKLPAEWMANNHDVTIVSGRDSTYSRDNQSTFSMKGIRVAAVLTPDVAVGHSSFDSLKYVMPHHRYMARNTMVNGHRRFFYPLGSKMFWMKNFAEEVKRQREWHPKNKPAKYIDPVDNSNVEVTLLPDLTRVVYDALAAAEDPAKVNKVNFNSVIVANGDGEVMAMADFNRLYVVNPNDNHRLRKLLDHFYIYGEMGSEKERDCFGSRNLVSIPFGPGSTQKPVLWTAVASHLDFDWSSLRIASYVTNGRNRVATKDSRHYSIPVFNEEKFRPSKPLAPLTSDENSGAELSLHDYMKYSSNVYNGLMAYIGSFREIDLQRDGVLSIAPSHDGTTLFSFFSEPLTDSLFVERFPVMNLAGGRQFSFNMKPQPDDQPHSLLENAMQDMFFRNDSANYLQYRVTPAVGVLKTKADIYSGANGYAYIEKSHFDSRQGEGKGREKGYEFMETAIRSTAIGGARVWFVTPWKMAESYARMASLNQDLHLSLLRRPAVEYNQFPNLSDGYKNARKELFDGMSDVLIKGGTLGSQESLLGITTGAEGTSNRVGPYFIYAKTGTMGTSPAFDYNTGEARMVKRGKKMSQIETDQRRLGVIITNRDLMTTSVNELADVRYVVLYFTSSLQTSKTYADVIKAVIGSAEFRQYMNK